METPDGPQSVNAPSDEDLPVVELRTAPDQTLRVLRSLQASLLKHPIAAQAAFTALVAEGRSFGATEAGRAMRTALEQSELLRRARLVFDFSTLSMLEQEPPDIMPSAYIDALFMLSSSERADEVLQQLFRSEERDDHD